MKFCYCTIILPTIVRKAIVPQNIILHERNAITLDSVGNDYGWLVVLVIHINIHFLESFLKFGVIVTINFNHIPTKRAPLVTKVLYLQGVLLKIQALHVIVINNGTEILQTEVVGKQSCLPYRAFITFAITHYYK